MGHESKRLRVKIWRRRKRLREEVFFGYRTNSSIGREERCTKELNMKLQRLRTGRKWSQNKTSTKSAVDAPIQRPLIAKIDLTLKKKGIEGTRARFSARRAGTGTLPTTRVKQEGNPSKKHIKTRNRKTRIHCPGLVRISLKTKKERRNLPSTTNPFRKANVLGRLWWVKKDEGSTFGPERFYQGQPSDRNPKKAIDTIDRRTQGKKRGKGVQQRDRQTGPVARIAENE